jgi:ABC-type antimicrobial peptide transport system permease subunit
VVQPDRGHRSSTLLLRLDEPESAGTFVTRARALYPPHEQIGIDDWRALHADALRHTRTNGVILATFSVLLALAIGFALATTIGGRVLAQSRELGVLKATGFTPVQVASVFMMENLLLGLAAALVGALAGAAVAPAFVMASVELVGAAPQPSFAAARLASAVLIVLAVVATCTFLPSWRRARLTTASILAPQGAGGRSRLRAAGASVGLPPAALVGIKDAFVRPGRASLTALSLALAVASVVGALAMEATFRLAAESVAPTGGPAPLIVDAAGDPIVPEPVPSGGDADRLRPIVYGLDAIMLAVALVTLLTTTLLNVRERSRELGVLKALGFTPRQVVAGVVANQLVLGFVALLVGIPLGVGLFRGAYQAANGSTDGIGSPEWWWLLLLCPAALALFGALAAAAARGFARMPVVEALRYE